MAIYYAWASDRLQLQQQVRLRTPSGTGNVWIGTASSFLQFNQVLTPTYWTLTINQSLSFNQGVGLSGGSVWNRVASNIIGFNHSAKPRVWDQTVTQTLTFVQNAYRVFDASNSLYFYQTITIDKSQAFKHSLIFNQTAVANITRSLPFTQTLNFVQHASVIKMSATAITTPSPYNPTIPTSQPVVMSYLTYSVTLRAPDFDNTESPAFTRVNRMTRGGDLFVYRDPIWPKNTALKYKWTQLKKTEAAALLQFINDSLGNVITLVDYENNTWTGVISTPNTEVSQIGRYLWSAELTIELS